MGRHCDTDRIHVCLVRSNFAIREYLRDAVCSSLVFLIASISVATLKRMNKTEKLMSVSKEVVIGEFSSRQSWESNRSPSEGAFWDGLASFTILHTYISDGEAWACHS